MVEPTRDDIDALVGPATPHFAYQLRARICELVEYSLEDIDLKGAWTGPASLNLWSHALAPVAELPVLEVISAMHLITDLTLPLGKVAHDYLAQSEAPHRKGKTHELA